MRRRSSGTSAGRSSPRSRTCSPVPIAQLRVSLVASHLAGVLVARNLMHLEPIASLPAARVVELVAPTLQRYLTGPL